ncbi:MAG: hypothetical protein WCL42_10145 [Chlorobiaceae bacterium]|jgi:hypothetical protein
MILKRIVFTIILVSGFCQPLLAVESASSNPTSGISPAVESGYPEVKKLKFIDEDGDGINDAVQGRAGFSNTKRKIFDGSCFGEQSESRLFMDGHVGRGFGKGSGSPRGGGPRR